MRQPIILVDDEPAGSEPDHLEYDFNSPFHIAAEELLVYYFWNYWCKTGFFPPFDELHDKVHDTEWFERNRYKCPETSRMRMLYNDQKRRVS